jgi:hypothetical protein
MGDSAIECEHVSAERAMVRHHTEEGPASGVCVALRTELSTGSPYESAGKQRSYLSLSNKLINCAASLPP